MPYRITPLANGQYYHVYNRGVAHQPIFSSKKDYERLLLCLEYYQFDNLQFKLSKFLLMAVDEREKLRSEMIASNNKIVELNAFVFMSNHFHVLLKQIRDVGISQFMKKITDSYTRYFNTRHERVGPLFQGAFKAVRVETDEQFLHLSRYIHLNPLVSFVVKEQDFLSYPWSSLPSYLMNKSEIVNVKPILEHFSGPEKYRSFVLDQADYGKKLELIKHLSLER